MSSNQSREDLSPHQIAPRAPAPESCLPGQWLSHTGDCPLPQETPQIPSPRSTGPAHLHLPYVKGVSERIERVCRHLEIKTTFKSQGTLREALVHTKQPQSALKKKGVVYQVPCADCDSVYIGETGRTLEKRLSEHRGAVKRNDLKNGIAVHAWKTQHRVD